MLRSDGFAPLEAYALIGNKRTAALVASDGAIDWWCPQAFDGPSVFAAVLDPDRGGAFTLRPRAPFTVERRYLEDTNVLETTFRTDDGVVRVTDAMALPSPSELDYNQLIRRIDGRAGTVDMVWNVHPRFGYGTRDGACSRRGDAVVFCDDGLTLVVQAHGAGAPEPRGGAVGAAFACGEGDVAVMALSSFDVGPLALADAHALLVRLDATADHWRRWASRLRAGGRWRDALARSALALDLMVDAATGAIVAAPTLGLPERIGGERNYDYRYSWLRDTNLTLEAMLGLGLTEQVHASLRWTFEAIAHAHPRLRPVHRLDGRATLPDAALALAGYRRTGPVRVGNGAQAQLQLDCYADVFEMVWKYVDAGNALADDAALRLAELADFLCRVWHLPDAGIWELRRPQQFTHGKLACHLALERALGLADAGHLPADRVGQWSATAEEIVAVVHARCWNDARQAYTRAAGRDELDAAVLLASRGGLLAREPERLSSTIDAIREELGAGGPLLYRFASMRGREGAFLACSFWAVAALARCNRLAEAERLLAELADLANDVGLYSEELDPESGSFLGNMPQALTHLAFVNAVAACENARATSPTTETR